MSYRPQRVGDLIQREIAAIFVREFEFPHALVTVSSVEVDDKLERALVNISVIPPEKFTEVMKKLEKAQGYCYHLLWKKLNIKPMPQIMFREDHGLENAAKIEKKLLEGGKE